jgi:hypothetical protein
VDHKRTDAFDMIAVMRAHLAAGMTPVAISYRFHDTGYHKTALDNASKVGKHNGALGRLFPFGSGS